MFGNFDPGDIRFDSAELDSALATVKSRVRRRRGATLLPVIVAAGVGAAAYVSLMSPLQSDRVSTVDVTVDLAASTETDINADDADTAETTTDTDLAAAAASGESDDSGAHAPGDGSTDYTSPAIRFDISNVITSAGPDSAPTSTPPSPDAELLGPLAGPDQADIDPRRTDTWYMAPSGADGSDAEVGASSETDGLEGSLDASSESSTGNPSAGIEGSGEGANPPISSNPAISFAEAGQPDPSQPDPSQPNPGQPAIAGATADAGEAVISAVASSAATSVAAEGAEADSGVSDSGLPESASRSTIAKVVSHGVQVDGQLVTLTLQISVGDAVLPCGVYVDWGDGLQHALPCEPDCSVPAALAGAQELSFSHTYNAQTKAEIKVRSADTACVDDPGIDMSRALNIS